MGLFDKLGATLKGVADLAESAAPGLIASTLAKANLGDLQALVNQLQSGGLDAQVKSWLSNNANLPVDAEQLRSALGNQQVRDIAARLGLPVDAAMDLLAKHLPAAVDQASPIGTLTGS